MDLNLRQVRAFVTVSRLGSFTRAASALNVSQPALTVQLRNLEQTLGSRLLDRNSQGVELTRIGRELLPVLQKTLLDVDMVLHDARELGSGRSGTVRLAALPSFAASLLPDLIRDMRNAEPAIRFLIRDAVASVVNALVLTEEVDVGLTGGDFPEANIETLQAAEDRLCLVYPQGHPIGTSRRILVKNIVALPLVLTASGTSVRAVVDAAFSRLGVVPNVTCEPTYMMTAVAMVRAGLGLTILPGSAREVHAEPGLRFRPIDDQSFVRRIALVKKRGRTLPPTAEKFVLHCVTALKPFLGRSAHHR